MCKNTMVQLLSLTGGLLVVSLGAQSVSDDTPIAVLEHRSNIENPHFDEHLFESHLASAKVDYVIDKMKHVAQKKRATSKEQQNFLKSGQLLVDKYAELSRHQRLALIECLTIKPDQA